MQQERTAETVSEKRRRGRRPAFPLGEDAAITAVWGGLITTKRSLRNKQYCVEGARAICPEGQRTARYAWFANDQRCRQAVLVELGRIAMRYGDATARSMADELAHKAAAGGALDDTGSGSLAAPGAVAAVWNTQASHRRRAREGDYHHHHHLDGGAPRRDAGLGRGSTQRRPLAARGPGGFEEAD